MDNDMNVYFTRTEVEVVLNINNLSCILIG